MHTLKKFIHYYQPYKLVFFIDLICAAIISLVDLSYPQILRTMTKTLFTRDTAVILHALPWIASGLLLMYLIQSLCKYYVTCQGHMMGANMERDMRQQLFDHYEELSFSYYSQNNSGQMMSKLVSDLFDISEFAHHGPENLFISVVKIIGAFIFLFMINHKLAFPLAILVVVMFLFSFRQNRKMQETFMETAARLEISTPVCRTLFPVSGSYSPSQMKIWNVKNLGKATMPFFFPKMITTTAWDLL